MKKSVRQFLALLFCLALLFACAPALAEQDTVTEARANQIAADAVREKLGLSDEELDSLQFYANRAEIEGHSGEVWVVSIATPYANGVYELYQVTIEPKTGGILLADIQPDAMEQVKRDVANLAAFEQKIQELGRWYSWPMEEQVAFEKEHGKADYRMPTEGDLPRDEAIRIAREALVSKGGLDADTVEKLPASAVLLDVNVAGRDSWMLHLYDPEVVYENGDCLAHLVYVSNPDGEVLDCMVDNGNGNG